MSASMYEELLSRAEQLEPEDQLRLVQELIARVQRRTAGKGIRSIRELRGFGKVIWAGTDAQAHVDAERDAWVSPIG